MSDIKSTIRIEDGFTDTLTDLTKQTWDATDAINTMTEAVRSASNALKNEFSGSYAVMHAQNSALAKSFKWVSTSIAGNMSKALSNAMKSVRDRTSALAQKELSKKLLEHEEVYDLIQDKNSDHAKKMKSEIDRIKSEIKGLNQENPLVNELNKKQTELSKSLSKSDQIRKNIRNNSTLSKSVKKEALADVEKRYGANEKALKAEITSLQKKIKSGKGDLSVEARETMDLLKRYNNPKEYLGSVYGTTRKRVSGIKDRVGKVGEKYSTIYDHSSMGNGRANVVNAVKQDISAYANATKDGVKNGLKSGWDSFSKSEGGKIARDFGSEMGKIATAAILQAAAFAIFEKLKQGIINSFMAARNAIQNSLEDLEISNKFESMYGSAGKNAQSRSYSLANELGMNATAVGEMSFRAANQGIGTKDFERVMRLSDKIGKLSIGETTESAAQNLLSNIKNSHDAGSFAQMLGGGQVMEQQLRRAGFERALNRGDLNKALDIAEKITEQAGFTDEKYKQASNSLSENYKRIENIMSNIKHRISEIYVKQLEPAVNKFREFLESEKFKTFIKVVEFSVKKIGAFVSGLLSTLVDMLPYLGVLFGVGLVAKSYLFIKNIKGILSLLGVVKGALIKLFTWLGAEGIAGAIKNITVQQAKVLLKEKAIAAVKLVGPWVVIAGAIAGVLKLMHAVYGETKSFGDFLWGLAGAAYVMGKNIVMSVKNFFKNIDKFPTLFKMNCERVLLIIQSLIEKAGEKLQKFGKLFGANTMGNLFKSKNKKQEDEKSALEKLKEKDEEIKNFLKNEMEVFDILEGAAEEYESNGATLKKDLGKLVDLVKESVGLGKEQNDTEDEISTNTDKIRRMNEQEEELRWLKAFSDRQIMSSYNSTTSNNKTINFNGANPTFMAEMGRRTLNSVPSRAAM